MTPATAYPRVAFLGLGLMGLGMARRLVAAGVPLTVYNRTPERADALVDAGARLAPSPREAAAGAEIVIVMVADDVASRTVWLGADGAIAGAAAGTVLIDASTLSPDWSHELATAASRAGLAFLDAPVTGSKPQAAAGELTFLVGGSSAALERATPVLAIMSRAIVHVGPSGSGTLLKLINNFLGGVQTSALAEAITLIERSGLDRARALEVLTNGAPGSPIVKAVAPRMTTPDYTPNFHLALMAKDLAYAVKAAEGHDLRLSMALSALELFHHALATGSGAEDFSAVIEPVRRSTVPHDA